MIKTQKSKLSGKVVVPPSKSQTIRALLFAAMACGESRVEGVLNSPDADAMKKAMELLGANFLEVEPGVYCIQGIGGQYASAKDVIYAGNSGLVLRFVGALAGLIDGWTVITGDESIRSQRPVKPLLSGLRQLGAEAHSMRGNDLAPILIKGKIKPGKAMIEGRDSQPVSGLLIALSQLMGESELEVIDPGEKPWVNLTLDWLKRLGVEVTHTDFSHYRVKGKGAFDPIQYQVPGDFSSAAFPAIGALICDSHLEINQLDFNDPQGDKAFFHVLKTMGANIQLHENSIHIQGRGNLKGIEVDVNAFVDVIPALATLACFAEGKTVIRGASIARQKESDRISCTAKELRKMGAEIEELIDGLVIHGGRPLKGSVVHSHHDHRLAMALFCAGMGAKGEQVVQEVRCVNKTYPGFFEEMKNLGACVST